MPASYQDMGEAIIVPYQDMGGAAPSLTQAPPAMPASYQDMEEGSGSRSFTDSGPSGNAGIEFPRPLASTASTRASPGSMITSP